MIRKTRADYRPLSGCSINILSNDELDEIHRATLEILEDTGMMILNGEAQEIFYSHGCEVDKKTNIVRIPPYLVEEALTSAPSKLLLAGRNPKYDIVIEGTRVGFMPFGVAIQVLDLETGKIRESTNKDVADAVILADAADGVDVLFQPMTPRDVPSQVEDVYASETCFTNSSKHFIHAEALSTKSVRRLFEMGAAVSGGEEEMRRRPVCSTAICPISPLQYDTEGCECIIESARLGIPCDICSEPLAGATGPVTLAGTLVIHNVENLAGITLSQLVNKGTPIMYGSTAQTFDLQVVNALVGNPEFGLINAATARIAQYYNLPNCIAGG